MADVKVNALLVQTPVIDDYILGCDTSSSDEASRFLVSNMASVINADHGGDHFSTFRGKNLGTTITDAQNTAIKNRTYTDLFIGDYWVMGGENWRIAAIDYYYNVGDTNFNKGNIIVVPDTCLYNAQMHNTDSGAYESGTTANNTTGGYTLSDMFTTNLDQARTTATNLFGSHVATHRILCASNASSGRATAWAWRDSDGVELMNEMQVYGSQHWGKYNQNGYDIGTQKTQFPLFALAPQFINTRQNYWLQDVCSTTFFAFVYFYGNAYANIASAVYGVRPAITLTYI